MWLRKLGGAKNPKLIIEDSIERVQAQTPKSISVAPPAKKVVKKEDKLTPEGLRPGERSNRWQFILMFVFPNYILNLFEKIQV